MASRAPKLPKGTLYVELIKGHDTKGTEGMGLGKADAYSKIKLARHDRVYDSNVHKDGGSEPVWNQTFEFVLESDRKYNDLTISLFNKNKWRDDNFLGEARIELARLVAEKGNRIPATFHPVILDGEQFGWIYVGFNFTPSDAAFGKPSRGTGLPESPDNLNSNKGDARPNSPPVNSHPSPGQAGPKTGAHDSAKDAIGSPGAANGGISMSPGDKGPGKPNSTQGQGESKLPKEEHPKRPEPAVPKEDDSAQDANSGNSSPTNSGTLTPDVSGKGNNPPGEEVYEPSNWDNSTQDEEPSTYGDQPNPGKPGGELWNHSAPDKDGDNSDEGTKEGQGKSGGLRSAATSILEASKGLGRKLSNSYTYTAVPTLVIAFLVFAAVKRKGSDRHGDNSDGDAASLKNGSWRNGMPTSSRQKILFYRTYGKNYNP